MQDDKVNIFDTLGSYFISLAEKSRDVFWVANANFKAQIYVNNAFEDIWGYDCTTLYNNPLFWRETLLAEDKARLEAISRLPHSNILNPYQERYRIVRADGEIRWILDNTVPILHDGKCIGYMGIAQEVVPHQKTGPQTQAANQLLSKLAEKMEHSAFWVRDPSLTKQLYLSRGFEEIWGRPIEFLYQNPLAWIETLVPEDRKRDTLQMVELTKEQGEDAKFSDTYRIRRPDGEVRWIKDTSFPIFDEEENCIGYAGIAQDITKEQTYALQLQEEKDRAESANIAKSNFIASMSHDLRTPLNGLLGMAEILRSGRCYPEQKEYIEAIFQSGTTLLGLIEDIINFVTLDLNKLPLAKENFDLEKLIEEILLTVSPQAHEKKIEMIMSFSEAVPRTIFGDANRTRRILMNLIYNAVKFTDQGHVLVKVDLVETTEDQITLKFIIEDTGIGIAPENFDYIFGSFNRVDPSYHGRYKGTGLGLTIVKQFIEDMGGTIRLTSQLGVGSVFYCTIPFKAKVENETPKEDDRYRHIKTLIIDDFTKRAQTFIKQFGLQNADIATSEAVVDVLKNVAGTPPYGLIIVDNEIKHFNVIELAKIIRQQQSSEQSILVLITDKKSDRKIREIKKSGYLECIFKPLQSALVVQMLENIAVLLSADRKLSQLTQTKNYSVLLIEDDAITRRTTTWMLEQLNCKVDVAGYGRQALELLDNPYDLIITDIGLPDMDGIQLTRLIRRTKLNHAHTPIVALTAHVLDKDKEECLTAGMNHFLKKPLFLNDLKKLLLKVF